MEKVIPETFVYYLSYHRTFGDLHDISMLKNAYQLQPDNPGTYSELIVYYECKRRYNVISFSRDSDVGLK